MICAQILSQYCHTHFCLDCSGLRALTTVWATHMADEMKRTFYKNWHSAKRKAFTKYAKKAEATGVKEELERAKKYCSVIRAVCHTQIGKVKIGQKKAHALEIQINGGSVSDKVDFVHNLFEQVSPY